MAVWGRTSASLSVPGRQGEEGCTGGALRCGVNRTSLRRHDSVYFVHLPHTGGTTLRQGLLAVCGDHPTLNCYQSKLAGFLQQSTRHTRPGITYVEKDRVPRLSSLQGRFADLAFGHLPLNKEKIYACMTGIPFIFTVIRDPYEVARSDYFHNKIDMSPNKWLKSGYFNSQTTVSRLTDGRCSQSADCEHLKGAMLQFDTILERTASDSIQGMVPILRDTIDNIWPGRGAHFSNEILGKSESLNVIGAKHNYTLFDSQVSPAVRAIFHEKNAALYDAYAFARTLSTFRTS